MTKPVVLYGLPHSLYTGKVRSYFRKQGIAYREVPPSDSRFTAEIVPRIGRGIIPVVELPNGTVIQDTVDIIDHFEREGQRYGAYPTCARQRAVAHLFELYSVVGLTRHAMHYRWSYLEQQEAFLRDAFGVGGDPDRTAKTMARMHSYLPMLGVTPETIPEIERSYGELLAGLNAHFGAHPYLLGGLPSIGDYALFGPLFAHLGRDPVPLAIMQHDAPKVFRWVERMHAPDLDTVEYGDAAAAYLPDDVIPDTLSPILRQIAAEILPDCVDRLTTLEHHAKSGMAVPGQPVTAKPHQRIIGTAQTRFRGVAYKGRVQPYLFFLWQRLLDTANGHSEVVALFAEHGLEQLVTAELPVRVERSQNIEVWGELSS